MLFERRVGLVALALIATTSTVVLAAPTDEPPICARARELQKDRKGMAAAIAMRQCKAALAAKQNPASPARAPAAPAAPAAAPAPAPAAAPAPSTRAASAPQQGGRGSVAGADPDWVSELPPLSAVQSKIGRDVVSRDAALAVLKDYIDTRVGSSVMIDPSRAPKQAAARFEQYRAAQSVKRIGNAMIANVLSAEAQALFDDPQFRLQTLSALLSPKAVAAYRLGSSYRELEAGLRERKQVASAAAADDALARRLQADRKPGVDYKVFDIELGKKPSFPPCGEMTGGDFFSALAQVGKGGPHTCSGDAVAAGGMMGVELASALTGQKLVPQSQAQIVPVRLSDKLCASWVRGGGTCNVFLSLLGGYVVGVRVLVSIDSKQQDLIMKQLVKKYGPRTGTANPSHCVSGLGIKSDTFEDQVWQLSGLTVTWSPYGPDCQRGEVTVELDTLKALRGREQQRNDEAQQTM